MPRVDATRNYYADLEIAPSASADDIKKQYRKLVLQWHPDRNRGREEEASQKFQTVQAAFEILTDPTSKRQYDDARNKTSSRFTTTASGVRGNPWSNAGSEWAPPPRRANPNPPPGRTGPQARPTPGASRYSNFTAHAAHRGKAQKEDPATAKSTYEAWNNMRAGAGRKPANTSNPPPPTPGRPPTSATRDSRASESEGMHRSASQRQKAQASFGNSSRRSGFTPRSPGLGDEPPVSSNNYFTTRTHTNIFNDASASTARQNRHAASAAPDPLAQFRDHLTDDRQSTPYSTPGGEKMSLFDDEPGLARNKSTRQSTRNGDTEDTFPFPRQRPRSSSTPRSSSNDAGSEDSTRVNTGTKSDGRRNSTKSNDRYRPKSSHSATQEPAGNAPADPGATSQNPEGSPAYAPSPNATSVEQNAHTTHRPSSKAQKVDLCTRAKAYFPYCGDASSGAVKSDYSRLTPIEKILGQHVDELVRKKRNSPGQESPLHGRAGTRCPKTGVTGKGAGLGQNANVHTHNSFNFGVNESKQGQKRFASSSAENINTKFVEEEHSGEWEFTAGGASADGASGLRSQSGSRLGRRSPNKISRRPVPPREESSAVPPVRQNSDDDALKTGFSAEEWGAKIGSEHFVPQPPPASGSPTRRTNSRKNSKPIKVTKGGSAGLVDEDDEIPVPPSGWQDTPKSARRVSSPAPMDIDPATPPAESNNGTPKASQATSARNINVEPTRPEWRRGDINGNAQPVLPPRPPLNTDATAQPFTGEAAAGSKSEPRANPFTSLNGGSEDSEEFRTNFADFKKVEPFTDPTPTGLQSFADLKTTLPFESQPSSQIPLDKPHSAPSLAFPTAPVAPRLPPTMAVSGLRPSISQWRKYAQDFYNYMDKWEAFYQKVLDHFTARQMQLIMRRQQHSRAWLEGIPGIDPANVYLTELEQDSDVRQQWMKACEDHQARIREFVAFRDRAK